MQDLLTLEKIDNGRKLKISVKEECKDELKELNKRYRDVDTLIEALQYSLCNGWDCGTLDTYGHLTCATFLSDDMEYDENESRDYVVTGYLDNYYAIRSCIDVILRDGYVIFEYFNCEE